MRGVLEKWAGGGPKDLVIKNEKFDEKMLSIFSHLGNAN